MTYTSSLLNWSNVTNPAQLIALPSQVTSWFWPAMLLILFFIVLITLLPTGYELAIMTASLIAFTGSFILMLASGMTSAKWSVALYAAILFGTILFIYIFSRQENT